MRLRAMSGRIFYATLVECNWRATSQTRHSATMSYLPFATPSLLVGCRALSACWGARARAQLAPLMEQVLLLVRDSKSLSLSLAPVLVLVLAPVQQEQPLPASSRCLAGRTLSRSTRTV